MCMCVLWDIYPQVITVICGSYVTINSDHFRESRSSWKRSDPLEAQLHLQTLLDCSLRGETGFGHALGGAPPRGFAPPVPGGAPQP